MPQHTGEIADRGGSESRTVEGVESVQVLHVDDERDFASMAAEFVQRQDERFNVETATSASEAIERLQSTTIDCVVSDYDMPGQNGIEFLETVREDYPELPFILFTGKGSEEVASDAISAGVTDYLQKQSGTDQYPILANRIGNAVAKRRAEDESERLRVQQRAIAENTSDAIVIIDANSTVRFANQAVEDLFGYEPNQVRGSQLTEFMPERYRQAHSTALKRYLTTGERTLDWGGVDFEVLTEDGQEVPVSISFGDFHQNGEARFVGVIRDITEQKQRVEELRAQRTELRQYKRAVEGSTDLLAACDKEYNLLFANEQYRTYHGLSADDIADARLPEIIGENWDTEVQPRIDESLNGEVVRYEMDRSCLDGELRTLDIRYYPLWDERGDIVGAVAAMRDITERTERERELLTLKERFQAFAEHAADIITVLDDAGMIEYQSPSIEQILGYNQGELLGENAFEYIHPDDRNRVFDTWTELLEVSEPTTRRTEYRFKHADGHWVWLESNASNRTASAVGGFVVTSRDISERK